MTPLGHRLPVATPMVTHGYPRHKVNYSSLTPLLFNRLHLVACFDLVDHIHPLYHLAEDGILPVEPGSVLFEDVKL